MVIRRSTHIKIRWNGLDCFNTVSLAKRDANQGVNVKQTNKDIKVEITTTIENWCRISEIVP